MNLNSTNNAGTNAVFKDATIDELKTEIFKAQSELKRINERYSQLMFSKAFSIFVLGQGPRWLRFSFRAYLWFHTQVPIWIHRLSVLLSLLKNLTWFGPRCLFYRIRGLKCLAIFRLEHLGDIICCEPIVREVRRQNPRAFIVWFVNKPYLELVTAIAPTVHAVGVICYSECEWIEKFGIFNRIVNIILPNRRCHVCGVKLEHQPDFPINQDNYCFHGSLVEIYSKLSGITCDDMQPNISIPATTKEKVTSLKLPTSYIVFHTIPKNDSRCWPIEKWRELAFRIASELKIAIVEVGLKSAIPSALPVASHRERLLTPSTQPLIYTACGVLSLLETAEVIQRGTLFIGTDSGPAHMANSFKIPAVILLGRYYQFASFNPFSGYYSKNHAQYRIIRHRGNVSKIEVTKVVEEVTSVMKGL